MSHTELPRERVCPARGGRGAEAGTTHCHVYTHRSLCDAPSSLLGPPGSGIALTRCHQLSPKQMLERKKGSWAEGSATGLAQLPCPALPPAAHWAPRRTSLEPVDTNPEEPRPPSPGHSCSVSALEGTLRTSVFPEAASGCHQHIYSKKGRIFPEQGGKWRLQLKLITEE